MDLIFQHLERLHARLVQLATRFSDILLLIVRVYWGYQFFLTGWGKLNNLEGVTGFFESLGIPFPAANAVLVGSLEALGGIALIIGLGSRVFTLPLIGILSVAYATDDREALMNIWSDPEAFLSATPFLFLAAALLIFAFGPGRFAVDHVVGRWWSGRRSDGNVK